MKDSDYKICQYYRAPFHNWKWTIAFFCFLKIMNSMSSCQTIMICKWILLNILVPVLHDDTCWAVAWSAPRWDWTCSEGIPSGFLHYPLLFHWLGSFHGVSSVPTTPVRVNHHKISAPHLEQMEAPLTPRSELPPLHQFSQVLLFKPLNAATRSWRVL